MMLYGETWWAQGKFLGTYDCSLKTMSDLKGKRISLGLRGQSDWGVFPRLLLEEVFGITPDNRTSGTVTSPVNAAAY